MSRILLTCLGRANEVPSSMGLWVTFQGSSGTIVLSGLSGFNRYTMDEFLGRELDVFM
jgi:hypothetical protein